MSEIVDILKISDIFVMSQILSCFQVSKVSWNSCFPSTAIKRLQWPLAKWKKPFLYQCTLTDSLIPNFSQYSILDSNFFYILKHFDAILCRDQYKKHLSFNYNFNFKMKIFWMGRKEKCMSKANLYRPLLPFYLDELGQHN